MSTREQNDRVAGAANSVYAEKEGGYAGPRDPQLKPEPRQEGQATIKNNPDFATELSNPKQKRSDMSPDELAECPPDVTPQGP